MDTLIFEDADSAIHHGDCRDVLSRFPEPSVDFVLTDPPYGVEYQGRWNSGKEDIVGDASVDWISPTFERIWDVLKPDSLCLSFYGWPHAERFLSAWKGVGFRPVSHIVCVKNNIGLGRFSRNQHEAAYLLAKGNPPRPESVFSDVYDWDREPSTFHPSQKPVGAMARLVRAYSKPGDLILDPFMGSGTTLVAARNMGRRAIGIDIELKYCQIARLRLAQQRLHFNEPEADAAFHSGLGEGSRC